MNVDELAQALPVLVPFVGTLGIRYDHIGMEAARLTLPDRAGVHNHLGQPHAGALFTLAESAAGAVVVSGCAHLLDRVTPVVTRSVITFSRAAQGETTADAAPTKDVAATVTAAEAGEKAALPVSVTVHDSQGNQVATADFDWVLLPHRAPATG